MLHTRTLVLGIDPGEIRPSALAGSSVLSLDEAGNIDVVQPASSMSKVTLQSFLATDELLTAPGLRLVSLAAPLTPRPLEEKPRKTRAVEIRLARGAFSGTNRGPHMPWIANPMMWPHYRQAMPLLDILTARRFPLITIPHDRTFVALPPRCTAEVFPKASLAVLTPTEPLLSRPRSFQFLGDLDDWLFPRLFSASKTSSPPIEALLHDYAPGLYLSPDALREAERITRIRRPWSRREPLRAFVAALQGILALGGAACLVGAVGDHEGSILLPATWHPDWEAEWRDSRRAVVEVRRLPVRRQVDLQDSTFALSEHACAAPELV